MSRMLCPSLLQREGAEGAVGARKAVHVTTHLVARDGLPVQPHLCLVHLLLRGLDTMAKDVIVVWDLLRVQRGGPDHVELALLRGRILNGELQEKWVAWWDEAMRKWRR